MSVKIDCPDCNRSWVLDEASGGGEFICPTCLARIAMPAAVPVGAAAGTGATRAPRPASASPGPPKPAASRTTQPPSGAPAPREDEEVVCPRCQLHFYPRGRTSGPRETTRHAVLIVEDQEYFRQIAADALEENYEVKAVAGTAEARELLARGGIDLLVLDLTLGGGDEGEQLLRELTPKPCPILIFTAQDESELYGERWEELSRFGADDLVMKGMQVGESLRRKVDHLLGQPIDDDDGA